MEKIYPPYKALNDAEIRVLKLRPGRVDDPIIVSLEHVSLDDPIPYEAMSYVWGDGNDLHPITHDEEIRGGRKVHSQLVTVTRNLRDALQHFRHPKDTKTIWVDALCINQQNISERAQQVCLMRDIYMKASRVLLWLGREDDSAKIGVRFLQKVAEFCQERTSLAILEEFKVMGEVSKMLNLDHLPELDERGALAARQIFDRPWFKRIWVIQEVAAGQDVLVAIGHIKLPFFYLGLGASWIRESRFTATGTVAGSEGMRNAIMMWQKRFGKQESPANLLDDGRDMQATDPRDKVYGLLGFTALRQIHALLPAYEKSVEEVYTDTSLAVIAYTGNLDMLSFAEGPPCINDSMLTPEDLHLGWPDTPTWVARWDEETYFPTSAMCELSPHKSRAGPPTLGSFTNSDKSILTVEGRYIDEVVYVAPYVQWPESPDAEPIPLNPLAFLEMWQAITARISGVPFADILSAWAQVLTGGITASYQPAQDDYTQHCADMVAFMLDVFGTDIEDGSKDPKLELFISELRKVQSQLPSGDVSRYQMAMVLLLSYRRVFLTRSGYLGLGHSRTRIGDKVVWLFGSRLPFMLRSAGSRWRFVGEAYSYNVRDGHMFTLDESFSNVTSVFEII